MLRNAGKPAEALKSLESARAIYQKLADDNPSVTEFVNGLASSHNNIGVMLYESGKPAEALKSHESARKSDRSWPTTTPPSPGTRRSWRAATTTSAPIAHDRQVRRGAEIVRVGAADPAEDGAGPSRVALYPEQLRRDIEQSRDDRTGCKTVRAGPRLAPAGHRIAAQGPRGEFRGPELPAAYGRSAQQSHQSSPRAERRQSAAEAEQELAKFRASDPAMVAMDARLAGILKGDQTPRNNSERLQLAQRAYDMALHSSATQLWIEALTADPSLIDNRQAQHRYNAACAAALAGCGQGKDDPRPDDAAKAKLRRQAHDWLRAQLAAWAKILYSCAADMKAKVAPTLQHWKEDTDLAGIRDEKELAKLPEDAARCVQTALERRRSAPDQGEWQRIARCPECPRLPRLGRSRAAVSRTVRRTCSYTLSGRCLMVSNAMT